MLGRALGQLRNRLRETGTKWPGPEAFLEVLGETDPALVEDAERTKAAVPLWLKRSLGAACLVCAGLLAFRLLGPQEHVVSESPSPTPSEQTTAALPSPSPSPTPVSITLSFAGDCTLGMDQSFGYSGSFNAAYDAYGPAYFLQNVQSIFAQDDLTVVNFEGTLTDSDERADKTWAFRGDPAYAKVLSEGSVEAVNLANNHSSDYGEESLTDTKSALDAEEIVHFGFEDTALVEVQGVKVGLLGMYTVYTDDYIPTLQRLIGSLQDQGAQVIVASFHWGFENSYTPEQDQRELAHAAIDAGAHLVIGHHPHVLQGIEEYNGRYIAYSLGNFCFGGNYDPSDYDCIIAQQTFTVSGTQVNTQGQFQAIPCSVSSAADYNNYQPTPAQDSEKERILEKLQDLSDGLSQ